jgi:hypothetical protein
MNIKLIAKIFGVIALGLTIIPPILNATESLAESTMKGLMLAGCVLWFVTAPTIMKGSAD